MKIFRIFFRDGDGDGGARTFVRARRVVHVFHEAEKLLELSVRVRSILARIVEQGRQPAGVIVHRILKPPTDALK